MMYERTIQIRAEGDKLGTFSADLFTGGEASDGHVLNIEGAHGPESIPMFVNHYPDPIEQPGRFFPRVAGGVVVARGEIFLGGEGPLRDIRRDIAAKVQAGVLRAVSGRWDAEPDDVIDRVALPKDHPAWVSKETSGVKRWGKFFERFSWMEGSIAGLGADPSAVMRWATDDAAPAHVRSFWMEQAADPDVVGDTVLVARMAALEERISVLEDVHERIAAAPTEPRHDTEEGAANEVDAPIEPVSGDETPRHELELRALVETLDARDARLMKRWRAELQRITGRV